MDTEPFPGFVRPSSTDTPNEFFTQVAPRITKMSEMKVVIYTIYRTFGFRKWEDWISLSQYENGTGYDGDRGCGLSHTSILKGLKLAVDDGYLRCRILCPHCGSEVQKTETREKRWNNRHGEGTNEIPVVPEICPYCGQAMRGLEHPYYRLSFRDELVDEFDRPQDYLRKYNWGANGAGPHPTGGAGEGDTQVTFSSSEEKKLEKVTYPQVRNSSPQVTFSSSEAQKLEKVTSHALIRSHAQRHALSEGDDLLLSDLIDLIPDFKERDRDAFLERCDVSCAIQWFSYALDPHNQVRNPAGFLVHCCLQQGQREPNVHYEDHEIRRIVAVCHIGAQNPDPVMEEVIVVESPQSVERPEPDPEAVRLWSAAIPEIEGSMARKTFEQWVRPARPLRLEEDRFTIGVDNVYAQEWLATRLRKPIERALGGVAGRRVEAVFRVDDGG